jgi:hypothetical protein
MVIKPLYHCCTKDTLTPAFFRIWVKDYKKKANYSTKFMARRPMSAMVFHEPSAARRLACPP